MKWIKLKQDRNKGVNKTPTASIIFSSERIEAFLSKSVTRQEFTLSTRLVNILPEVVTRAIRKDKEIKDIQIIKEAAKLFTDGVENPKESTKKATKILSKNGKVGEYNISHSIIFLYTRNENIKNKS